MAPVIASADHTRTQAPIVTTLQQATKQPWAPIADLLGFELTEVERGRAVVTFEATSRHANPMGTLHGGVLCDIADAAMGVAYASTLEANETFTTLELKMNFLKPVWQARLQASATLVKGGRTIGLVECDVRDASQALVARASSTCMTLRGAQAQGRGFGSAGQQRHSRRTG